MKSQKTMLSIARAQAYEQTHDIEVGLSDQVVIGYWLSYGDLCRLYYSEGFSEAAVKRHLKLWQDIGAVRIFAKRFVFFVPLPTDIQTKILHDYETTFPHALIIAPAPEAMA